ncbi:MAG: hypothetical protein KAS85_01770 [Rhodobacteraceae bacterium]|nr:hypothetical protein [Paracoccaceae bacterium]
MKTTLALISFLVIGFLIYPMVSTTQWDKLEFNSRRFEIAASSAPLDWRALISD